MENTLNDVIEKLESLGYTIENDVTNTILEIEKLNNNSSNLIDVKPIYLGKDNSDLFIISDFVGEKLKRMNFEIYAYPRKIVLEQPTFNNLIDVIKQMSY
ncbi:hypothetical protein JL916_04460 [Staphylococcus pseudintermedius]|uniref:hypothetical protein n=1 Tax=Staphylococcus pseudintermedius TaxID=283734 RepID=UPI000E24D1D3|nr:hypothetical protein [Staphylococcus pseudintermedius]EGQ3052260.1 hypothetical protein [Staphylococcus pseudintermedius]EGQ3621622.1 hypothetical protein [Staphylococcus pseudintermedius]EGQ3982682.1 hypothetical protein [Staphylococcus pseudintermedius]EIA5733539.1 hypothetical protein [Staphylococcus pseudintermedius]EIE3609421.1 hypothetical protein [Staphylococcus pseudintermedius]